MTLTSTSRPAISGRVLSKLPATLTAIGGISVSKLNGIWTIKPDFSGLNSINAPSLANPSSKQVWVYDPVTLEYNVLTLAALGDALYAATSATSLAIGAGSKAFTTQPGKDFALGSWVIAYSSADAANYMVGRVTAYAGTLLTVTMTAYGGSGTKTDWIIRACSPPGAQGKSSGYAYSWLTDTTAADPTSGKIKVNNATFSSITEIYLSETDADGNGISAILSALASGTSTKKFRAKIYDPVTPTNFMEFDVTALADGGTWDTLTVAPRSNGGAFTAALALRVDLYPFGDKGDTGAVPAIQFNYSTTTTDADPGSGIFRLNNAAPASATAAYIDNNERGGTAVNAWLDTFDDTGNSTLRGTLLMFDPAAPTTFYEFSVSGSVVDGTGYRKLTIAYVAGQGSFTNGGAVGFVFTPRGPSGAGDLTAANNLSDLASPKTGYDNISVHGSDVVAAATINLDAATGNQVDVTGNTAITAVTLTDGRKRWVHFTGTPVLTHGASLVLPGAANITMAAGDWVQFVGFAAGVVRVAQILRAAGRPLNSGVSDALTKGFSASSYGIGTVSSGTTTLDPLNGNIQDFTNNGASTLAPPAAYCSIVLDQTNGASAGTLTRSGFTKTTGDMLATTNALKYRHYITVGVAGSHCHTQAMQ